MAAGEEVSTSPTRTPPGKVAVTAAVGGPASGSSPRAVAVRTRDSTASTWTGLGAGLDFAALVGRARQGGRSVSGGGRQQVDPIQGLACFVDRIVALQVAAGVKNGSKST